MKRIIWFYFFIYLFNKIADFIKTWRMEIWQYNTPDILVNAIYPNPIHALFDRYLCKGLGSSPVENQPERILLPLQDHGPHN